MQKETLFYLIMTIGTAFFGAIYEAFSFGVYSPYMMGAFFFPLLLGVFPTHIAACKGSTMDDVACALLRCGILTLTVGSLIRGALAIYGTSSRLLWFHALLGVTLVFLAGARRITLKKTMVQD